MKIHYLQHISFEGPANIAGWAKKKGHAISGTKLHTGDKLPPLDTFDWLIVLGGPMNIYEEQIYPWLAGEKVFIREAVARCKAVLGICLGAQLLADVLGGEVVKNNYPEIGWHPVTLTPEAELSPVFRSLPAGFTAFHWHGDTFTIPPEAKRTAASAGCANQAFDFNGRVIGLQFHLESTPESIDNLIENCGSEIVEGKYIQSAGQMVSQAHHLQQARNLMELLLDNIEAQSKN